MEENTVDLSSLESNTIGIDLEVEDASSDNERSCAIPDDEMDMELDDRDISSSMDMEDTLHVYDISEATIHESYLFHPSGIAFRVSILIASSLMCAGSYFVYSEPSALSVFLAHDTADVSAFEQHELGYLFAMYALPSIVMSPCAGVLVDFMGITASSIVFTASTIVGTVLYALSQALPLMMLGRFIYGFGAEALNVLQSVILSEWFKGRELGLAFGITLFVARLATTAGMWVPPQIVTWIGYYSAVWFCVLVLLLSAVFTALVVSMTRWAKRTGDVTTHSEPRPAVRCEPSAAVDFGRQLIRTVVTAPLSFWLLTIMCMVWYSVVLTFFNFGETFLHQNYGLDDEGNPVFSEEESSWIMGIMPLLAAIITPIVGFIADKTGQRLYIMGISSFLLMPCFAVLAFTQINPIPVVVMVSISYSMFPAAFWPCIPLVIEDQYLGTAYGIAFAIQNAGSVVAPIIVGGINTLTQDMKHPFAVGTLSYALMAFVAVLLDISLFFCKEGRILNYPSVMPDALPIDIEGISTDELSFPSLPDIDQLEKDLEKSINGTAMTEMNSLHNSNFSSSSSTATQSSLDSGSHNNSVERKDHENAGNNKSPLYPHAPNNDSRGHKDIPICYHDANIRAIPNESIEDSQQLRALGLAGEALSLSTRPLHAHPHTTGSLSHTRTAVDSSLQSNGCHGGGMHRRGLSLGDISAFVLDDDDDSDYEERY